MKKEEIELKESLGEFAEDKDRAREIRVKQILPTLEKNMELVLNFKGIELITQSCMHALIADVIRKFGPNSLDMITFKNCSPNVKGIIEIVIEYSQEVIE